MAATSSPSLSFNSTSTPVKSNPHPYAIKTTSTGVLTRSNSTTSTSSSHRFVPSSPSNHKSTNSHHSINNTSSPRPRAHKYSRSLNSNEFPRPLPIPPTMTSPTTAHFDAHFHIDDPLPTSLSQPNLMGPDDLPPDPRIWSPSQLSTYLASSSLRVTAGDVSPLVVQDIAAFVRTQKINGRKFLRLTEGDLDKYGLNQRWQSALLAASRCLRQDSIRGRIWTSSSIYPSDVAVEQQEEDNENYSSTSSVSSSGSISDLHRERAGSQSGRVKGMVASFERHGTPSSSSSSRSISPTKDSTAVAGAAATAAPGSSLPSSGVGRSLSPVKVGDNTSDFGFIRPRPQSDTFPSYSHPSFMSNNNNNNNNNATFPSPVDAFGGTPKKVVEQPRRLLPLPPQLPHNTSSPPPPPPPPPPPQPQFDPSVVSSFGPYVLPLHQQDNTTTTIASGGVGTPFPPGILPFSPQSTGTVGIDNHPTSFTAFSPSLPDDDQSHLMMMTMMMSSPPVPIPAQPPIYASSSPQQQEQQSSFDTAAVAAAAFNDSSQYQHQHHFAEGGVRPLPLPPHPSQFYQQPLINSDNGFVDLSHHYNNNNDNDNGGAASLLSYSAPAVQYQQGVIVPSSSVSPQQQLLLLQRGLPAAAVVPVPHVQIEGAQAPMLSFIPDSSSSSSHHHHQQQQQQQQYFPLNLAAATEQQQQPNTIIHAPQPRLGRDSPTKILEEKLEELLEPRRPRSRIFPVGGYSPSGSLRSVSEATAAGAGGHSKSRSTPGGGSRSRPRSRVPSMNLTPSTAAAGVVIAGDDDGTTTKKLNGSSGVGQSDEQQDNNSNNNNNTLGVPSIGLGTPPTSSSNPPHTTTTHPPRTRVISLPRTLSHRLSGVEAWGESHRHMVLPPDEDEDEDDLEIVHHPRDPSNEDAQVKELEGEEEVGIEALLEKDVAPSLLPAPPPVTAIPEEEGEGEEPDVTTLPLPGGGGDGGHGHTREVSGTTTAPHSRAGSLREPKSAVITVIEHRRSSVRLRSKKESDGLSLPPPPTSPTGRGDGEEDESIEALLAKADALGGSSGSNGGGGSFGVVQNSMKPMNGAEAWEMIRNIDTVKHLDGAEPAGPEGGGLSRSIEDIFSPVPVPLNQSPKPKPKPTKPPSSSSSPPSQIKTKPKSQPPNSEDTNNSGTTERELERSIGETRKMVEEIKRRLDKVEHWISDTERREYQRQQQQQAEAERRRTASAAWPSSPAVDAMRRMMLSASRVPGMLGLGLSTWLGSSSTSTPPPSFSSTSSSTSTQTRGTRNSATPKRSALILRFAKLGLSFSTYTVLFGISFCVIVLRMLGKRPGGVIAAGLGGGRGGAGMANGHL